MLLIVGDQRRVGLGGKALGKVESSGGDGINVINSKIKTGFGAVVARGGGPPQLERAVGRQQISLQQVPTSATLAFEVTILRSDGGLAASPPFGYTLETAGEIGWRC